MLASMSSRYAARLAPARPIGAIPDGSFGYFAFSPLAPFWVDSAVICSSLTMLPRFMPRP